MICRFLCVPFLIKAQGNQFRLPDSIYHAGNYRLASVEYERVVFENDTPSVQAEAALRKASCQKMLKDYSAAAVTLDAVGTGQLGDSLRYRILFTSALYSYLAHQPASSFSKFEVLDHSFPDSAEDRDVLFMEILSLNELRKWHQADSIYQHFMMGVNPDGGVLPDPYAGIPRLKDPSKAEKLSAYLPFTGAGLFYAGAAGEGILNLVLQVGFIGFGAYSILMERYITGVLIGVGGYAAFYHGGVRRAKWLAEKYNERKTIEFNTRVRNQLLPLVKK